jgi:hypothetical protein
VSDATHNEEGSFDDQRELCGDGSCLGILVDGKCNVCGLAAGEALTAPRDPGTGQTGGKKGIADAGGTAAATGDEGMFDDEDRQLCPDGACTGILGSDGKCKECGRSAAT